MANFPLRAKTQNSDWEGTAAADNMGLNKLRDYLKDKKLMTDNEFIVAVNISSHEIQEEELSPPTFVVYLSEIPTTYSDAGYGVDISRQNKTKHIRSRCVSVKLNFAEVFGFFKRFDIVLTPKSMDLVGRTLKVKE